MCCASGASQMRAVLLRGRAGAGGGGWPYSGATPAGPKNGLLKQGAGTRAGGGGGMQTAMKTDEEGLGVAKWPGKHAPAAARCLAGEEQQDGRRVGLQRTARAGQSSSSNRQNSTARASFTLHSAKLTLMASGADIAAAAAAARCCAGRSPAHSGGGRVPLEARAIRWCQLSGRLQLQPRSLAAQEAAVQEWRGSKTF